MEPVISIDTKGNAFNIRCLSESLRLTSELLVCKTNIGFINIYKLDAMDVETYEDKINNRFLQTNRVEPTELFEALHEYCGFELAIDNGPDSFGVV